MPLVGYLVARDGLPPRRGLAYDYVLAGDGLYLVTENHLLSVRIPVARCTVRGLPPLYPACVLKQGRLPALLWEKIITLAYACARHEREVLCAITGCDNGGYCLAVPHQIVGRDNVFYRPLQDGVLEIHSHHRYPAYFSPTDDADEQRLCLYGVVGRLDSPHPEVALRVGAYGHSLPVPWESVFDGGRDSFRDVSFDEPEEVRKDDDLPH